jgi:hypothetical protein
VLSARWRRPKNRLLLGVRLASGFAKICHCPGRRGRPDRTASMSRRCPLFADYRMLDEVHSIVEARTAWENTRPNVMTSETPSTLRSAGRYGSKMGADTGPIRNAPSPTPPTTRGGTQDAGSGVQCPNRPGCKSVEDRKGARGATGSKHGHRHRSSERRAIGPHHGRVVASLRPTGELPYVEDVLHHPVLVSDWMDWLPATERDGWQPRRYTSQAVAPPCLRKTRSRVLSVAMHCDNR